jgi:hypothetical protein
VSDIIGEIYDMAAVNEENAKGITLSDLQKCGQGHTIVAMLLDVAAFWQYDNRESLV